MIAWKTEGTKIYNDLAKDCHDSLKETNAHHSAFEYKMDFPRDYTTWKKKKKN